MSDSALFEHQMRLHTVLLRMLEITATTVPDTLNQASNLIAEALATEKVDIYLYEGATESLVAVGTSSTPLAARQAELGLDRLPIANGGREVEVFLTGAPYRTGQADKDPQMLPGLTGAIGARSEIAVPLDVDSERRGVLTVNSTQPNAYSEMDYAFLQGVARWVETLIHRAELIERDKAAAAQQGQRIIAEEITRVLAHDMRNYLTPLHFRLTRMVRRARKTSDSDYLSDAESALVAVQRCQTMIHDLLDDARLAQGVFTLNPTTVGVCKLVQDTADFMQTMGGLFVVDLCDELDAFWDAGRVRQVLENLLGNALRYAPAGTPVQVVVVTEAREGNEWVRITVTDKGPGIEPELLPRLFDRYTTSSAATGLGLGLYVAKQIALAHGGDLTVRSVRGRETSFDLTLPVGLAQV